MKKKRRATLWMSPSRLAFDSAHHAAEKRRRERRTREGAREAAFRCVRANCTFSGSCHHLPLSSSTDRAAMAPRRRRCVRLSSSRTRSERTHRELVFSSREHFIAFPLLLCVIGSMLGAPPRDKLEAGGEFSCKARHVGEHTNRHTQRWEKREKESSTRVMDAVSLSPLLCPCLLLLLEPPSQGRGATPHANTHTHTPACTARVTVHVLLYQEKCILLQTVPVKHRGREAEGGT